MSSIRTLARALLVVTVLPWPLAPAPAGASFHLMKIREVFVGQAAQYVELQMFAPSQNFVIAKSIFVFNAAGTQIASFAFGSDVANGADQDSILVATDEAQTMFGISADLTMTAAMPSAGGKVCFETVDCVSWGSFSGSRTGTGTPFNASEGIPHGAGIERNISGGTNIYELDAGDDTDDSAADFFFTLPSPRNNARAVGTAGGGAMRFELGPYSVVEGGGIADVTVGRLGGAGSVTVDYSTADGTATAGSDYTASSGTLSFDEGQGSKTFQVGILDDAVVEASETVRLRLRNPNGGAVLAPPFDQTLTILDDEPADVTGPTSRVRRPRHGRSYPAGKLTRLRGAAADDASGVERVQIALRKKLVSGACRWWNDDRFIRGPCKQKRWVDASGTNSWTYRLSRRLGRSVGTKTKNYALLARAVDVVGNVERSFRRGRNLSLFEIT